MTLTSVIERTCAALGIDLVSDEIQVIDGARLPGIVDRHPFGSGLFPFTPLRPMLIANVSQPNEVEAAASLLSPLFADDHPVKVVERADALRVVEATIGTLRQVGKANAIYVPASDPLSAGADPRAFQQIIARLRDTDGCPWDRKQTHRSLRDSLIDEVYEVVDAIASDDPANLAEELGDLFLLIVMHAQMATESDAFTIEQVYRNVATKIVGRHPHVFGDVEVAGHEDLIRIWNDAKAKERSARPGPGGVKAVDGEPPSMPALTRAARVLDKYPRVTAASRDSTESADLMLDLASAMIANGDDPEAQFRDALMRHVLRNSNPAAAGND